MKSLTVVAAVVSISATVASYAQESDEYLQRAIAVLNGSPIIDGHNDLPWVIREKASGDIKVYDLSERREHDTDILRLREGRVGAQFWSVWVPSAFLHPGQPVTGLPRSQVPLRADQ